MEYKNYWAVYHPTNRIMMYTLSNTRSVSINHLLKGSNISWKQALKLGWTVRKVNITITLVTETNNIECTAEIVNNK